MAAARSDKRVPGSPAISFSGVHECDAIGAAREAQKRTWQTAAPIHRDLERRISRVAL